MRTDPAERLNTQMKYHIERNKRKENEQNSSVNRLSRKIRQVSSILFLRRQPRGKKRRKLRPYAQVNAEKQRKLQVNAEKQGKLHVKNVGKKK